MSAAAPIPPLPLPAPRRSPFRLLLTDPWIAISWLLLIGTGTMCVLTQLQSPGSPTVPDLVGTFLATGYVAWSAYFGLAACWRYGIVRRLWDFTLRLWGIGSTWMGGSFLLRIIFGYILFVLLFSFAISFALGYAVYGGGIYHFARRWWLLAHGQQPPFLRRY